MTAQQTGPPWPTSNTDRARDRYAYVTDDALGSAILTRLAEIMAWDRGPGAELRAEIAPLALRLRVPLGGLGVDREPSGFSGPDGNPPATLPDGLTGCSGRHGLLVPTLDDAGAPWRALLGRAADRPALGALLESRGVPPVLVCPDSAVVHRARMVAPAPGPNGSTRPGMLLWEHCDPSRPGATLPGLSRRQPWEFDLTVELVRAATAGARS